VPTPVSVLVVAPWSKSMPAVGGSQRSHVQILPGAMRAPEGQARYAQGDVTLARSVRYAIAAVNAKTVTLTLGIDGKRLVARSRTQR
jgi:hypothetical protein